jgi:SAM-dependent methyltransferase
VIAMNMWDERYGRPEYAYGTEPNDFLRAEAGRIPRGRVLCLAEGEGRNAVHLAGLGHEVTAVDLSIEGLRKARELARERGVSIAVEQADLATYVPAQAAYEGVVTIFGHLPAPVRERLYGTIASSLVPGGVFVLEAYRPEQLAFGTGGPRDRALLASLDELRAELVGLDLVVAREVEREIHEGALHDGRSATVQIVGVRRG